VLFHSWNVFDYGTRYEKANLLLKIIFQMNTKPYLSTFLSICPSICLTTCCSVSLLFIWLNVSPLHLSDIQPFHLGIGWYCSLTNCCLSVTHLSVHLSVYLYHTWYFKDPLIFNDKHRLAPKYSGAASLEVLRPSHFWIQFSDRISLTCTVCKLPF